MKENSVKNKLNIYLFSSKIYRFGGEEFCVIVYGFSAQQCLKRFDKIEKALEKKPFVTEKGAKDLFELFWWDRSSKEIFRSSQCGQMC